MQKKTKRTPLEIASCILFWMFIVLIYLYTVFFRPTYLVHNARWKLFWSYPLIWNGNRFMLSEVFYNLLMLIPVGVLWPLARQKKRLEDMLVKCSWVKRIGKQFADEIYLALETTVVGFTCSFGIEIMQLLLKRGLFEWDDMMHNTFGSMFGFSLTMMLIHLIKEKKIRIFDWILAVPFLINCVVLLFCKIHISGGLF